ncbi:MAG: SPOR domain-containing protein [Brevundimonas sp.]|nr:SPOR domain-containing protein [Brevundimonas sp.]
MTPSLLIRPVLACLAAASLAACGMVEADPHRFETMGEAVAAIPLETEGATDAVAARTAAEAGLRPALQVEVMDPHALWDARDGGLRGMAEAQGGRLAAAAAPAAARAVVRDVAARIDDAAARTGLRPSTAPRTAADAALVQIGAYSSEAAARAAWARLDLDGLSPVFEAVEVDGRRLTRLKVRTPADRAAAVCAAAGVDDPWCRRAA